VTQLVLTRIAPWPAARILAVLYLVLGFLITPLMLLYAVFNPEADEFRAVGVVMAIFMPFIYAIIGFVTGLVGGALYNVLARMFGGIPLGFESAGATVAPHAMPGPGTPRPGPFGE
jgi:hypothetical protein